MSPKYKVTFRAAPDLTLIWRVHSLDEIARILPRQGITEWHVEVVVS